MWVQFPSPLPSTDMHSRTTSKYRHQIRCITQLPKSIYRGIIDAMDELDSHGIQVSVVVGDEGILIQAPVADRLLAAAEFRKRGFTVL